jgi:hypothetical protein
MEAFASAGCAFTKAWLLGMKTVMSLRVSTVETRLVAVRAPTAAETLICGRRERVLERDRGVVRTWSILWIVIPGTFVMS